MASPRARVLRLCPNHRRSLSWEACTPGTTKCDIEAARDLNREGLIGNHGQTVVIPPDILALPVSRTRKLQMTYRRLGLCIHCGDPRYSKTYCLKHHIQIRERARTRHKATRRYLGAKSYKNEEQAELLSPDQRRDVVRGLLEDGLTALQIAIQLGTSKATIRNDMRVIRKEESSE